MKGKKHFTKNEVERILNLIKRKLKSNTSEQKGIRDKIILIAGGTQVSNEQAVANGMDAGFGRGTKGEHVATFLVKKRREINEKN